MKCKGAKKHSGFQVIYIETLRDSVYKEPPMKCNYFINQRMKGKIEHQKCYFDAIFWKSSF